MVKAWYMKDPVEDQFAPNELAPSQPVSTEKLLAETGVDVDSKRQDEILQNVQQVQSYSYRDTIEVSEAKLGEEFSQKLAIFFNEHLHTDDEVRFPKVKQDRLEKYSA